MLDIGPLVVTGPVATRTVTLTRDCGAYEGHEHKYDHTTMAVVGRIRISTDAESVELNPGDEFATRAGVKHTVEPLDEQCVYKCVYSHRDFNGVVSQTYGPGCTREAYV